MEEIDIWRTAKILMDAHGDKAWLEAAQRADHAIEDGNTDAEAVWKRVLKAITELDRQKPAEGQGLN
jgi:hypothetical protein